MQLNMGCFIKELEKLILLLAIKLFQILVIYCKGNSFFINNCKSWQVSKI
jgi:hypothetical protein